MTGNSSDGHQIGGTLMRNVQNFLVEDNNNIFGPGTDLIVSLTAVLIILIAIKEIGQIDLQKIRKNQMEIINKIATEYNTKADKINDNKYGISTTSSSIKHDIIINNDVTIQRFTFGSHILFDVNKTELKKNGEKVLTIVGKTFKEKLDVIQEIQIQGHADPQNSSEDPLYNIKLAARRAITVFEHFQYKLGIDPTRHIMSATSFGEYKPVQRKYSDMQYNTSRLEEDNYTDEKREKNRRIEVVLIYRRKH